MLRCVDLMSRDCAIVTEVDAATGHLLLHVSGGKAVLLPTQTAARLRRHLGEGIRAAGDRIPDE
ncbi:hypothetical protein DMP17_22350 [Pseudonocardia sp. TMWB2A]